ncbi:aminoglycoside phosphotransferase [Pollutimonas nitritireducens]|uniref:Aminoglycoside phosphotransferase n=1 Tax=Pollutimonas nitritireducens TaxID=2045209 RepID=A0A2N4UK61_9BURK|nr:phosphotransferase [Pollutimonas nitritireducens]PLC55412.1 aminoglycoside phosphotransferase [Pollutimonas nitritireducens]
MRNQFLIMENRILNFSAESRLSLLKNWLQGIAGDHQLDLASLRPASSDASFRRYFRLDTATGTAIVMDAPPQQEDCRPFIHVTGLLAQADLNVPTVLAQDLQLGFLLLTDLGEQTYYQAIKSGLDDTRLQQLYRDAIAALVRMQQASTQGLPDYDAERLSQELAVFPEWYAQRHCQVQLSNGEQSVLNDAFAILIHDNTRQPSVLVHRDFHSPNLMVGVADRNPGVIDYQDALVGPLSYDIASLVMDARTTWEEQQQLDWAIRYWEAARAAQLPVPVDFADFHRAYEWMGLQRNLRILGVFARLSYRDGKHHYLDHMPRVNTYVRQVAGRYSAFRPLIRLLDKLDGRQVTTGYTF